jgi:predicted aconitase
MHLTAQERGWLNGTDGPATRRAMEIVVALARIYGAERLVPVRSVQISGVSYRNIGAAGLKFLRQWRAEGASVRVPTTLNPTAMDMKAWQDQGFDPAFAEKQRAVVETFAQMGVGGGVPIPTCTPYLIGNRPALGDHLAWAESSAVSFANSVLGARTNREGGPGAIAAAITGRTGMYGLHLDANRIPTLRVDVEAGLNAPADYSALGAIVGREAGRLVGGSRVIPYFVGLPLEKGDEFLEEKLKALGAAMAATGAVALYHVPGITPEAPATLGGLDTTLTVADLAPGYARLSDDEGTPDLVWIGCPHASLTEIEGVARAVVGATLRIPLWVTCARPVAEAAADRGWIELIEAAGGRVFTDACMAIAPVRALGFQQVATPSAKGAYYLRNLAGVSVRFGPFSQCVEAARKGRW